MPLGGLRLCRYSHHRRDKLRPILASVNSQGQVSESRVLIGYFWGQSGPRVSGCFARTLKKPTSRIFLTAVLITEGSKYSHSTSEYSWQKKEKCLGNKNTSYRATRQVYRTCSGRTSSTYSHLVWGELGSQIYELSQQLGVSVFNSALALKRRHCLKKHAVLTIQISDILVFIFSRDDFSDKHFRYNQLT